jgi:D-alanyl-D-alanine carboxypeptidase/D-alanyl-D-alanine-endopeptidase (penicillin-binding protein 4)
LSSWVERVNGAEDRFGEQWSVYVEDLQTRQPIFVHQSSLRLTPASCRKLATTALALDCLSTDYRFQTVFGTDAPIESGRAHYHGNLILRSSGDPTLGPPYLKAPSNPIDLFRQWGRQLADRGVRYVHGDLIIDATAFGSDQSAYPGDVWEMHHKTTSYAAVPSALTINKNVLSISVRPSRRRGDPGRVNIYPSGDGIDLDNETVTSGMSSGVTAAFEDDSASLKVSGRINEDGREQVDVLPLADPLRFIAANMADALAKEGIHVTGQTRILTHRPAGQDPIPMVTTIGLHEAPSLDKLLIEMVRDSDNFLAEQIWMAATARVAGTTDRATARRVEQNWLNQHGLGWIEPGWDGCGLSRKDLFSAREMVLITRCMYDSAYRDFLMEVLPIDGEQGTLRNRSFSRGGGRVRAKTGTLAGVSALTGFIFDKNGQPRLIFSMIGNSPGNTSGRLASRINELTRLLIAGLDNDNLPGPVQVEQPPAPTVPVIPVLPDLPPLAGG